MRAGAASGESFGGDHDGAEWLRPRAPLTGEEVGMARRSLFSYYGNHRRVLEIEEESECRHFRREVREMEDRAQVAPQAERFPLVGYS